MRLAVQIRGWCISVVTMLALAAMPSSAQNRREQRGSVPRPNAQQHPESRPQFKQQPSVPTPRPQSPPQQREYKPYQPPAEGHHSGQWLNNHRELPLDQQRRALQNDPQFRRLPPERQQRFEQRLQRFDSMPPERQQQVLRRMETWEHLTPQQKQEFRGLGQQFDSLPPDRRHAVRNAIDTLRAMPPAARERELQSGRFSQFSPQEREILNGAARLPLAPAEPGSSEPEPNGQSQRYVPRPPR